MNASRRNSVWNVPGLSALAIRPPASPPSPIPRFIITRCVAKAVCRLSGGVRPAIRLDWLGQKPPLPIPAIAAAPKACHGSVTNGYGP